MAQLHAAGSVVAGQQVLQHVQSASSKEIMQGHAPFDFLFHLLDCGSIHCAKCGQLFHGHHLSLALSRRHLCAVETRSRQHALQKPEPVFNGLTFIDMERDERRNQHGTNVWVPYGVLGQADLRVIQERGRPANNRSKSPPEVIEVTDSRSVSQPAMYIHTSLFVCLFVCLCVCLPACLPACLPTIAGRHPQ